MANRPKQKGTARETNLVQALRLVWPRAERSADGRESSDFFNCGQWTVEAKHRKTWQIMQWIRKIRKVADGHEWVILIKHGRMDTVEGREVGRVAVIDEDLFFRMAQIYEMHKEQG